MTRCGEGGKATLGKMDDQADWNLIELITYPSEQLRITSGTHGCCVVESHGLV